MFLDEGQEPVGAAEEQPISTEEASANLEAAAEATEPAADPEADPAE